MLQTSSSKPSKNNCQWDITITWFVRLHRTPSAKFYTNPLKFHPLCHLEPVHGYNLARLPANCYALKYLLSEISLVLRPVQISLCSRIKLPKLHICWKLPIRTPWGLLKVVQSENIRRCFVTLLIKSNKCHKLPSRVYCQLWAFFFMQNFPSYSALFL